MEALFAQNLCGHKDSKPDTTFHYSVERVWHLHAAEAFVLILNLDGGDKHHLTEHKCHTQTI